MIVFQFLAKFECHRCLRLAVLNQAHRTLEPMVLKIIVADLEYNRSNLD